MSTLSFPACKVRACTGGCSWVVVVSKKRLNPISLCAAVASRHLPRDAAVCHLLLTPPVLCYPFRDTPHSTSASGASCSVLFYKYFVLFCVTHSLPFDRLFVRIQSVPRPGLSFAAVSSDPQRYWILEATA